MTIFCLYRALVSNLPNTHSQLIYHTLLLTSATKTCFSDLFAVGLFWRYSPVIPPHPTPTMYLPLQRLPGTGLSTLLTITYLLCNRYSTSHHRAYRITIVAMDSKPTSVGIALQSFTRPRIYGYTNNLYCYYCHVNSTLN